MGVEHDRDHLEARLRAIDYILLSEPVWSAHCGFNDTRIHLWHERENIRLLLSQLPEQDPIRMGEMT